MGDSSSATMFFFVGAAGTFNVLYNIPVEFVGKRTKVVPTWIKTPIRILCGTVAATIAIINGILFIPVAYVMVGCFKLKEIFTRKS